MEILSKTQKTALALFSQSELAEKFYWTGGTLLAYYYLQHRRSQDLDFFSEGRFSFEEIHRFAQKLKEEEGFRRVTYKKIFDRWEFLFENGEVLRIEFVYYNQDKKTLKKRKKSLGVYIDSLDDLAANKTLAYLDRNEPKDLFDIYFLLTKGRFTPKKLLGLVKKKFGAEFEESLFWSEAFKVLPLFKELKPLMLKREEGKRERLIKEIEVYFMESSEKFLKKYLLAEKK